MNISIKKIVIGLVLLVLGYFLYKAIGIGTALYRAKVGFNNFDTHPPQLSLDTKDFNVLIYSKTNGWIHEDAIDASKEVFRELGHKNNWKVTVSDNGAIFNNQQLPYFDVVVWNNVTGQTLNEEQRNAFKKYMITGGGFVGIHGSGDSSHHWNWYYEALIRALFSHHPMEPQFQTAELSRECSPLFAACELLPEKWSWEDEWYVFYESPRKKGSTVLYNLEETNLVMSGEFKGMQADKNWGMGNDHPVAWYHCLDKGRVFYTAMGHKGSYFYKTNYKKLLVEAIKWAGDSTIKCDRP